MMRSLAIACMIAASIAIALHVPLGHEAPPPGEASKDKETVMRRKLSQAQKLLEGLALNDFDKIKAAADELAVLRQKAEWMAMKTRDYEVFTNDFQRQIEAMQKAAKNKNIDAATLAYMDMTRTCVRCHQYVREERMGQVPMIDSKHFALLRR